MADPDGLEIDMSQNSDVSAADQKKLFETVQILHMDVRKLSIRSYGGTAFPKWLGNPSSMKNITSLLLADCSYCELLPPLGQLSSLEHLVVQNFSAIAMIGHEFFRSDITDCKPFQSLKTLMFERMPEWEDWELLEEEGVPFPSLQELYLINCPKLVGDLPKFLPSLVKLVISDCPELAASVPRTPPHCVVTLRNCNNVPNRGDYVQTVSTQLSQDDPQTNPSSSEVRDQQQDQDETRTQPSSSGDGNQQQDQDDTPKNPSSSEVRDQQQDQDETRTQPSSSGDGNQQQDQDNTPTNPSSSEVRDQQQVQDETRTQPSSSEDENQEFCPSMELPTDLCSLRIERYAWNKLPKEISDTSSLQQLYLIDCVPLKIFSLPPSLETLFIYNCRTLELSRPKERMNQLEDLYLGRSCDSLQTFPLNYFPKLKSLSMWDCPNLECLSVDKELQNELTSLDAMEIKYCPKLSSFFEEDEFRAPNLTSLVFFDCGSLRSLQRIQSFESLQSLYINKCPALESIPMEALPSGLIILCITYCDKITPHKGWKLDKLHSLVHFEIEGECRKLESFPAEGLLPRNLNSLRISGLLNLTSLDMEGLQKLTSLQTLEVSSCDKLDSLPEHKLPSSLSSLSITDCSLLNPKLRNRRGKEWLKIAHIPSIYLNEDSE